MHLSGWIGKIRQVVILAILIALAGCTTSQPVAAPTSGAATSQVVGEQPTDKDNVTAQSPTQVSAPSAQTEAPVVSTPEFAGYTPSNPAMGIELWQYYQPGVMNLLREAGTHWTRRNALLWSEVESSEGARNWGVTAGLEQELKDAAEQGLQVILIVRSTPTWAQKIPGAKCGPIIEEKLQAFANFMEEAVKRYSAPPYNVGYWEIWNEPDVVKFSDDPEMPFGCWGDAADPYYGGGYYAEMLKAIYPKIKAADPEAQVLVGGLLLDCDPVNPPEIPQGSGQIKDCTSSRFLEGILKNAGGDYFDGVSFHAYDYYFGTKDEYSNLNWHSTSKTTGPVLIAKARFLRSVLAGNGFPSKYLINTELALICGQDGTQAECLTEDFQQTKADYLAVAYPSAVAERLLANIWFNLIGWRGSNLVDQQMAPLPAFDAYKVSGEKLLGVSFTGEITQFSGTKGYAFKKEGRTLWILWSLDGSDHKIQLDTLPAAISDVYGKPVAPTQEIIISSSPLYLEWEP